MMTIIFMNNNQNAHQWSTSMAVSVLMFRGQVNQWLIYDADITLFWRGGGAHPIKCT